MNAGKGSYRDVDAKYEWAMKDSLYQYLQLGHTVESVSGSCGSTIKNSYDWSNSNDRSRSNSHVAVVMVMVARSY